MSRRFGRNQRRRAREALAAAQTRVDDLERAHAMDRGLLEHQSRTIADLREWLQMIADEVGHQAVLAGEPTILLEGQGYDGMRVVPHKDLLCLGGTSLFTQSFAVEVLRLLDVEVIRSNLNRQMHVLVALADKQVAYAITESAIFGLSRAALVRLLAPRIAEQLVAALRGLV